MKKQELLQKREVQHRALESQQVRWPFSLPCSVFVTVTSLA